MLALTGCFQDYDQFTESDGGTPGDAADGDRPDARDTQGDVADIGPDGETPMEVEVGTNCGSDDDCGTDGLCRAGYCTADCADGATCPTGSSCHSVGDERLCVLDCGPYDSCDDAAGRGDLSCIPEFERGQFGDRVSVYRACLPDSDGDQVFDALDNCPDTANGLQLDRDADGMGDACDSDALCHSAATDGIVDYGAVTYPATNFSVPTVAAHGWFPVVGGFAPETGDPISDVAILDRDSGGWTTTSLPYVPNGVIVGDGPYGNYIAAPGVLDENAEQVGPHLMLQRDGTVELDARYNTIYPADFLTSARFGYAFAFGETSQNSLNWRAMRYNAGSGYTSVASIDFESQSQVDWKATRDIDGDLVIYSDPNVTTGDATFQSIDYQLNPKQSVPLTLPSNSSGQFFRPIVLPGLGGVFYIFDRNTGEAAIIDPSTGNVTVAPELNLDFGQNVQHVIPSPESASLIVLSRPDTDSEQLAARELFIRCSALVEERDSDGDGTIDTRDNCPNSSNNSQLDTDRDGIGDSCDTDVDGDGIANPQDQIPSEDGTRFIGLDLDSDNDQLDNPDDDDDDGDGLRDGSDRFPFDTDNDGFSNFIDGDDDEDGFSDATERSNDTDQFDQFDFPNAGTIAFMDDDGTAKTIKVGVIADLENAVVRELATSGSTPSQMSFTEPGEDLVIIDGAPEQTQQIRVGPVDDGTGRSATTWQVGTSLRDVVLLSEDISAGTVSNATVVTETANGYGLVRVSFNPQSQSQLVSDLTQVREIALDGSFVGVIGAPADCPQCLGVYRFNPSTGTSGTFLTNSLENPRSPNMRGSTVYVVADNDDGTSSAFAVGTNSVSEIRPPGVEQVDSVVTGLGGGLNHLLLSGSEADGTFNLYFFNNRRNKWYKILETTTDIVDLAWTNRSPTLEQPQQ
jgi:hypothetical protein